MKQMNYKLLVTGLVLTAFFSCQETKKEDAAAKAEAPMEEPAVGTYTQTTDIPKGILKLMRIYPIQYILFP